MTRINGLKIQMKSLQVTKMTANVRLGYVYAHYLWT